MPPILYLYIWSFLPKCKTLLYLHQKLDKRNILLLDLLDCIVAFYTVNFGVFLDGLQEVDWKHQSLVVRILLEWDTPFDRGMRKSDSAHANT